MKQRRNRDFQIVESHLFTRRKSIIGYLYIMLDADEPDGRAMVYTDHLKHSNHHACTCTERDPRYICAHIKFIERTRREIPVIANPMATQYIGTTAIVVDETRLIDSTIERKEGHDDARTD